VAGIRGEDDLLTLLGYRNPLRRLAYDIRGWLTPPDGSGSDRETWVVGHRGAARFAAENTIASYQKAIDLGADAIEADICVTRDRRFVVWHDADPNDAVSLLRQAGGEGLLFRPDVPDVGSPWRKPVAELDVADLLAHYGYTKNEKGPWDTLSGGASSEGGIVTLEELFGWAARERRLRHVFLDIKLEDGQEKQMLELLVAVRAFVDSDNFREGLVFHFLVPHRDIASVLLAEWRRSPPPSAIALHVDFEFPGVLKIARQLFARDVSMGCRRTLWAGYLGELGDVVDARERGEIRSVVAWTVSDEKRLRELVTLGADAILTDDPALLRRIVRERAENNRERARSR
jgi:glycerophosphoryl diester phosphodiesterase